MEKTTAFVITLGIVFGAAVLALASHFGHEDNNRQKQVVEQCIQAGGNPQFYKEQFIGCPRG